MTAAPPALAANPQFTPEFWIKVPRQTNVAHIERVTNIDDDDGEKWVEIAFKEGMAFRRKKAEIVQLLTANLEVQIEAVANGEGIIVTGLMVPGAGWAFRMTAEDLAEYARELASLRYMQQQRAKAQAKVAFVRTLDQTLQAQAVEIDGKTYVELDPDGLTVEMLAQTMMDLVQGNLR